MDCLFCKIVQGDIPADILYQDDDVMAFKDINPQAPNHTLIIPKIHIATINDVELSQTELIGKMIHTGKTLARNAGHADDGYRLVFNCNKRGGQEVYHIHLHLLSGRQMTWPPG